MRYIDIKDHVISTSYRLSTVPRSVVDDIIGTYYNDIDLDHYTHEWEHPSIKYVTHAFMYPKIKSHSGAYIGGLYYQVISIVVDEEPAIVVVSADSYCNHYTLDVDAAKAFCEYLIEMCVVEEPTPTNMIEVAEHVDDLTSTFNGIEVRYGSVCVVEEEIP